MHFKIFPGENEPVLTTSLPCLIIKILPLIFTGGRGIFLSLKIKITVMNSLKIPGLRKDLVVTAGEIIRVEALSNYSRIHFADGNKLVTAKVLNWFENLLPAEMFVRVHRSHLVNKHFVEPTSGNSPGKLFFFNGESIPVSRRNRKVISECIINS